MALKETRSGGEGLERSCQRTGGWLVSSRPAGGVELFGAWFAGEAYQKHRHGTYAIGVTDSGVQVFDYRGSVYASMPGQVVVLYPDEVRVPDRLCGARPSERRATDPPRKALSAAVRG